MTAGYIKIYFFLPLKFQFSSLSNSLNGSLIFVLCMSWTLLYRFIILESFYFNKRLLYKTARPGCNLGLTSSLNSLVSCSFETFWAFVVGFIHSLLQAACYLASTAGSCWKSSPVILLNWVSFFSSRVSLGFSQDIFVIYQD